MKHLLTAIACCLAVAGSAQTWNPDADFDNVIGVNDLMALLSVFGSEWTAEYPQDPEYELAAYYGGYVDYWECVRTCTNNHAKIIGLHEYAMFEDSITSVAIVDYNERKFWLDDRVQGLFAMNVLTSNGNTYTYGGAQYSAFGFAENCICAGLVPAVEQPNREEKTQLLDHGYYGDAAVIAVRF